MTGSQLWLIQEIANTSGIGVSELAERMSIHQSTCSQLVEKLVVRQLIVKERSREDQRRVGLRLTDEAATLVKNAPEPAEGILPEALKVLSVEVMQSLDAALVQVISQLRLKDDKLAEKQMSEM